MTEPIKPYATSEMTMQALEAFAREGMLAVFEKQNWDLFAKLARNYRLGELAGYRTE